MTVEEMMTAVAEMMAEEMTVGVARAAIKGAAKLPNHF